MLRRVRNCRFIIIIIRPGAFTGVISQQVTHKPVTSTRIPVAQVAARRHLRSAARHQLTVPRHRLNTYGRRAFAVAGPMTFNSLCQL